jgi:hypothetical protein
MSTAKLNDFAGFISFGFASQFILYKKQVAKINRTPAATF